MVIKSERVLNDKLVYIEVEIIYTKEPILQSVNIWLAADHHPDVKFYNQEIYGRLYGLIQTCAYIYLRYNK